jgi:dipeptidyl aminopeptidase/acylaminoacyl peptidase
VDFSRYNTRVQRRILRGLISLAAGTAGLVLLSAAQGGAFSGANGQIAFTCGANICTINPDGTGRTSIVSSASDPSFSGDGTEIAYTDAAGISVADSDGFFPASLASSGAAGGTQPTFSFNGFKVAYVKSGDIYTINSDTTGNDQPLTATAALEADPAYSPDGTQIAYASNIGAGGTYDIRIITVATGISFTVTSVAGNERNPSWSPDGSTLVYTSAGELFKVAAAANSTPADLLVAGTAPAYSPDGTKIAYINAAGQLAIVNANGTGTPVIVDSGTTDGHPDWQEIQAGATSGTGPPRNLSYPTINLQSGDPQPVVGHFLTATAPGTARFRSPTPTSGSAATPQID